MGISFYHCNSQSFLPKHCGVHLASLLICKLWENSDQNGVWGQATKQRAVLSYIVLVMSVHENFASEHAEELSSTKSIRYFICTLGWFSECYWSLPLTKVAVGCLNRCLNVCLKVLLSGAGWLNVWTAVNRWIALLFWSTVSSFCFSAKYCMKKNTDRVFVVVLISSMHSASTGLF